MKVKVKAFAKVTQKDNIGKNKRTAYEQAASIVQEQDGYPDCPMVITHWDSNKTVLRPGLYEADLYFDAGPYGQMVPQVGNFQFAEVNAAGVKGAPVRAA